MSENVCFVDCETTGLDPDLHEIWEVGLILPDGSEHEWQLPVDLARADPIGLAIGRFHERRGPLNPPEWRALGDPASPGARRLTEPRMFAGEFVALTRGLHLAGAVVSFDADRLWRLLRQEHECPMWHYHLIDVEALAAGWIHRTLVMRDAGYVETEVAVRIDEVATGGWPDNVRDMADPPWISETLSRLVGVDPGAFDRHTALGDARWAKAIYEAVMA